MEGIQIMTEESNERPKILRGFAIMDPERRKQISSLGGKAVPPEKRTFSLNPEKAREAGVIGGKAVPSEKRAFSVNNALASNAGRKGGLVKQNKAT